MTLFGRLFNASLEDPEVPISSANVVELFGGELKNDAGVDVNEKKALGIMAVWCAVTLISGTIASLPLHAYKAGDSGERVRLPGTSAAAKLLAARLAAEHVLLEHRGRVRCALERRLQAGHPGLTALLDRLDRLFGLLLCL